MQDGQDEQGSGMADAPQPEVVSVSRREFQRVGSSVNFVRYLSELWRYRHFLYYDSHARVTASNSEDNLGLLWMVFNPILNGLTYYLIFGLLFQTSRGIENFVAYLMIGTFMFRFTSAALTQGARSLRSNAEIMRAFDFPKAVLPIAANLRQLMTNMIAYGALIALILIVPPWEGVSFYWLLFVPAIFFQFLFNTGISLILARIVAKVSDISQLIPFVMRIWMYTSAVFFSIEKYEPYPTIYHIALYNPMWCFLDVARSSLAYHEPARASSWAVAIGTSVVLFLVGLYFFWRGEESYGLESE